MRPKPSILTITATMSDAELQNSEATHSACKEDYPLYKTAEMGLMRFLATNFDESWNQELENTGIFYTNVLASKMMVHLQKRSGGWHAIDAVNIMSNMQQYLDKAARIPVYTNMMEKAQNKTAQAKLPISDDILVGIATKAILASDHFPRAADAWEEKTGELKTWDKWKDTYLAANESCENCVCAAGDTGVQNVVTTNSATTLPMTNKLQYKILVSSQKISWNAWNST